MFDIQKKSEPVPPGHLARLAGHHWLIETDFDGRRGGMIVLQWNPSAKRWSHSGNVGTGTYLNIEGWEYVGVCPMPGDQNQRDTLSSREFIIMYDSTGNFMPVDGICQFYYDNYQISISTAGMSHGGCHVPICIFDRTDSKKVIKDGFSTVQEAIDWILEQKN